MIPVLFGCRRQKTYLSKEMIFILIDLVVDRVPFSLDKRKHTKWTSHLIIKVLWSFCALIHTHSSGCAVWHDLCDAFSRIVFFSDAKHLLNLSSSDHTHGYRATKTTPSCQSIQWPSQEDHHHNLQTRCVSKQAMAERLHQNKRTSLLSVEKVS